MGLIKRIKNSKKPLLGQILELIPSSVIIKAVAEFNSDHYCKTYRTYNQLVALLFGQLNKCYTLRDIVVGFNVSADFLRDVGLQRSPARSTMSYGHQHRDWRVFEDIFINTLSHYERLFTRTAYYKPLVELKGKMINIVDSTTISLCLNLFSWASFRARKGAIKIHTQLDERSELPIVVHVSKGKMADRQGIDYLSIQDGSILIDDRAYYDYRAFLGYIKRDITFVTRTKNTTKFKLCYRERMSKEDRQAMVIKVQVVTIKGRLAEKIALDEQKLRIITVWDQQRQKELPILTNNLDWPAHVVAELYQRRWKIELFFKALKQNLQVKTFIGTSENAVKSQIYVALLSYILLEFIRRHLSEADHAFKQFVNLIRICLMKYQGLTYVASNIDYQAHSLSTNPEKDVGQLSLFNTS
jgi:DDE family transposase/uncharacterized protein DUF4372